MAEASKKTLTEAESGYRHSAAVTEDGDLYTWGEGDYGRLGCGDNNSRNVPSLVKDVSSVGQVACGSAHTLCISKDGHTVWSFGSGDNGKLGHGDTNRVYKPKVIEGLQGLVIKKVCCGSQFSLALTSTGLVFAWGCGPCLGTGSVDATSARPKLIDELQSTSVIDIAAGDSHCLALSKDLQVYAWGNNSMGQCGQGHCNTPITKPTKVVGLDGVPVHQIVAGTSHSLAWTALPSERQSISWHRPYCVDLAQSTFGMLKTFLEKNSSGMLQERFASPFTDIRYCHQFTLLCLELLSDHLSLASAAGASASVLGEHTCPLRHLLFKLLDTNTSDDIQEAVNEALSVGASLLLPPLPERMEVLHNLLPQAPDSWDSLTVGERKQLSIILTSMQDDRHIATLLGFSGMIKDEETLFGTQKDLGERHNSKLTDVLLKTLLRNLSFHVGIHKVTQKSDPVYGDRFSVDVELGLNHSRKSFRLSEYVYLKKGSDKLCLPKGFNWNSKATVYFIVPVKNQGRWVHHFINELSVASLLTGDTNFHVIVADFESQDIDMAKAFNTSLFRSRHTIVNMTGKFYKTLALNEAVARVPSEHDLLFLFDLHIDVPVDIMDSVRKNTIEGRTAYFPVVGRLDCGSTTANHQGFWELNGYGLLGVYKSDWTKFGGMDTEKFKYKWGGEDWDLLDRVFNAKLEVERIKYPGLYHHYHSKRGNWN